MCVHVLHNALLYVLTLYVHNLSPFYWQMEQLTLSENKLDLKEEMVQALQTDIVVS